MTSGSWGSGSPSGDGATGGRGSAGEQPRPDRTGSARVVIGLTFLWLTTVSFALWLLFFRERDGLLLLTTVFLIGFFWSAGVFTKAFWAR